MPTGSKQNTPTGVLQSIATITCHRDRDLLAQTLVSTLTELIHSNRIALYRILHGEQDEEAVLVAEAHNQLQSASTAPEACIVIQDRTDFSSVFHSGQEHVQPLCPQTFLSIYPIKSQHGTVGLLEIISDVHGDRDRLLISAFLKVYGNYLTILDESETDTLTGLLNRRTFNNNIDKIIAGDPGTADRLTAPSLRPSTRRMSSSGITNWLAVMDIDHFKRVNDQFGHLYGDEVLILLSRLMRRIFRQHDQLFRFGGEEFVVVLDRTSEENARRVLERFRAAVEHHHFPQIGQVTISIGFVRLDKTDVSSSLVGRADQALYFAKNNGRNQTCFYDHLVAEGQLAGDSYSNDVQLF